MNDDLSQETLIREFLVESEELLQRMDQDILVLETTPKDGETLNRVFRALHTIKGTAGFLGFDPIVRLSHAAEDVLNALRNEEIQINRPIMDSLLATRDQLGTMLRDLDAGALGSYALDDLLSDLQQARTPQTVPPLGELLIKEKVITADDLGDLLSEQAASPVPRKLGELIVEKGLSTPVEIGNVLARQKSLSDSSSASTTMRVDTRKLDDLVNLIGELVLERNRLARLSRDCSAGNLSLAALDSLLFQFTARLNFITDELHSVGLRTRMVPIKSVFCRFPRLVRDLARNLQKEAQLVMRGEETELDKTMVELIADPLVHLVRNSLDHGIETPGVRKDSGKSRQGTVRLEASQEGDQILIRIADDGAGIDLERVGRKAVDQGLVTAEQLRQLRPREILDFIFAPGFSTVEKTSDLSGRGVGMDVVRSNLKKLNGSIDVETHPGSGTTILLRLPLTLAILPVLLVRIESETYALPLRSVLETAQVHSQLVHRVEGAEVLCLRGETFPLLRLAQLFGSQTPGVCAVSNPSAQPAGKVVVLGIADKRVALLVDQLLGQESTVIKSLGPFLHHCPSLAGATIGGDGSVRLVLDPAGLLAAAQQPSSATRKATA